ncbi:MAG: NAD(P)/FAD-dependent oxidoreductase [Candidatus Methylomirabilales bacterium]
MEKPHHVVIIGGGFGGLYAAKSLKRAPVRVTLLDRRNFHLFQPLLYQVATGQLSPANIAAPLRAILKRQKNNRVFLAEAIDIDVTNRRVVLSDGEVGYDTLIVATGVRHHYFGRDEWERLAPGLKTIEDATEIRRRILLAFEAAEREGDPEKLRGWLTFVIVGGGPTGVELAGAVGEIAKHTLARDFRAINPADARIVLVEGMDRVLPPYPPTLSVRAEAALKRLGVTVRTGAMVTDIQPDVVTVRSGERSERIPTRTVLWAAGVQASTLGNILASATGATVDRAGRVVVEPDLSLAGHPEIFVIGDLAHFGHQTGKPLPGVAPVAMQQGRYVATLIMRRLRGETMPPFRYRDHGNMATIGRAEAVADLGWVHFSGFPAWLAWLFIHLINLVEFQNRVLVLIQWAWNYVTWNRYARLITGESPLPFPH